MNPNILILDLETQRTFDEVGGRTGVAQLGVSVVGLYSYQTEEYAVFWEKELALLENLFQSKPLLIGFNHRKFDLPVLQPYLRTPLKELPILDLMEDLTNLLGHRLGLDAVAWATLGKKKSGHGLDAIRYWQTGELEKLKKYCLDDVKLTKEIFEYGVRYGEVFYFSKDRTQKLKAAISWKLEHPWEKQPTNQMQLF